MKPRIRICAQGCIRFLCSSGDGGEYRCAFGHTMREAFEKWAVSTPLTYEQLGETDWDDVPF